MTISNYGIYGYYYKSKSWLTYACSYALPNDSLLLYELLNPYKDKNWLLEGLKSSSSNLKKLSFLCFGVKYSSFFNLSIIF
jgi:hypothetical protein